LRIIKTLFSKDSALLTLLFILGIAGLCLFQWKEQEVFPNASIDLSTSKADILRLAQGWATRIGYEKKPVIKSITFSDYDDSKTFLEYELGNKQANELMRNTIPVFYWYCSFRKPFDQETMNVTISPTGKLYYFDYSLPNDKKLPSINHKEAQEKAFVFVNEITGWQLPDCKLVDDDTTVRANRTDHNFTWEYQKTEWHNARLRAYVEFCGNKLTSFSWFLHRPEQWDRNYSTIRSKNELLESIASIFFYLLYPIAAFIFLRGVSNATVRWRFALTAGCVLTLISLLDNFNDFPSTLSYYSPESSFTAFVIKSIIYPLLGAPFFIMLAAILAGAGELVYRSLFPNKIALPKVFTSQGLRSREVLLGLIAGIAWFGVSLGYQICYYWIGKNFHFWCPLEVGNYQVLSSYCPWFSAVSLGTFASTNEEILYRILMLGLLKAVVRRYWLANLLQAAAWGFMHSNYPQQPCYARGLELTIEGMFDGWLLSRFGLLACVVSHYLFDAFQSVIPLFTAPTLLKLSAFFPFLPILIAIVYSFMLYSKNKSQDESLLNKATEIVALISAQIEVVQTDLTDIYKGLSHKVRWGLMCFTVFGLICYLIIGEKTYSIGETKDALRISREEAITSAKNYISDQHIDLKGYKIATSISNNFTSGGNGEAIQYIFEQIGFDRTKKLTDKIEHSFLWNISFIKPLTPSQYECVLDENGKLCALDVRKGEDEAGANLSQEEAQKIAENFLKTYRKVYCPFEFKDVSKTKRKNRTDYFFTFKVPPYKVGEADFQVTMNVIGDIPANIGHTWDVPDGWTWARTKQTKRQEISSIVTSAISTIEFVACVVWTIFLFKANRIRWKRAIFISTLLTIGIIVTWLNGLTGFFNSYHSTTPINTFYLTSIVTTMVGWVLLWGGASFGIAIALAAMNDNLKAKARKLLSVFTFIPQDVSTSKMYRDLWLDAIILALALESAGWFIGLASYFLDSKLSHEVGIASISSVAQIANVYFGPLIIGLELLAALLFTPLALGLGIAVCRLLRLTTFWRFCAFSIAGYILYNFGERYWQEFLIGFISCVVGSAVMWYSVVYILKRNVLTLFISLWIAGTYSFASELWKFGWPTFSMEFIFSCTFITYPFIYLLYLHTRIKKLKPST